MPTPFLLPFALREKGPGVEGQHPLSVHLLRERGLG